MRIELFGIARARAGRTAIEVDAADLAEAIRALARECPGLEPDVISQGGLNPAFVASINGERFVDIASAGLNRSDVLLILDAHSGG